MTSDGKKIRKKPSGLELTGRESGQSLRNTVYQHHILKRELPSAQREKCSDLKQRGCTL
jgi:hypothetical protein